MRGEGRKWQLHVHDRQARRTPARLDGHVAFRKAKVGERLVPRGANAQRRGHHKMSFEVER
ncbi:hypothetical protein ENSA5_55440 [Enhygromyxa salina]|uniref:Uncharacterized protein n=1 Tax=Enhygromyxa salina TaxID=215803 RepID=A0A2S9XF07_9BACT|nr:hypothetical protein ENSA5_55440 [Enhygromyxa salina]